MKNWKILYDKPLTTTKNTIEILLKNRGLTSKKEIEEFLHPRIEIVQFKNVGIEKEEVKKAIKLIRKTIDQKKAIVIYGDYDVDGITGTAIMWETLYKMYQNVHPYLPHRIDEGYGLSQKGISNITETIPNIGLIITVDNGIVAHDAVDFAKSLGIQVIITDHHTKKETNPKADATIHTTQLCGAGVAYLLSQEISNYKFPHKEKHLELVALATVADLVPLNSFNRTLLKFGLEKLRTTQRVGLLALFQQAKIKKDEIDTYHIGHMIAPRLNASGRISHAMDSLRLVCTTDAIRAKMLADELGTVNQKRQQLTFESAQKAIEMTKEESGNVLIVFDESFEQGVVGLIASRMVEAYYKPSLAISVSENISKGSARSIQGVNVIELIRSCSEFLIEAGGHPMAAGFSLYTQKIQAFTEALHKKAIDIDEKFFQRELKIDGELEFDQLTSEFYKEIQQLAPFGMGNPIPVFMTRNVHTLSLKAVGQNGKHMQVQFEKNGKIIKGIIFNHTADLNMGDTVDIVYSIDLNVWNNKETIELKIRDIT